MMVTNTLNNDSNTHKRQSKQRREEAKKTTENGLLIDYVKGVQDLSKFNVGLSLKM